LDSSNNEAVLFHSSCQICNPNSKPPELPILKDAMVTERLIGYVDFHDIEGRKYYRQFKGFSDFEIIRRFLPCNICAQYPNVTVRYFALNWPEYCIFAFTDTNIPEGVIMAYPEEPQKARITMLSVKDVVLSPPNETPEKCLFEIFCHFEPFRRMNIKGEYYFNI
uniref:Histone acetyltransferase n=1 Tax=Rodentolepis nana TaxID=102285 RepID=A0A0R3TVX5_RODNA